MFRLWCTEVFQKHWCRCVVLCHVRHCSQCSFSSCRTHGRPTADGSAVFCSVGHECRLVSQVQLTSLPTSKAVAGSGVCVFACFSTRYLKTAAARITKLDIQMFHNESWNPFTLGLKGQGHESQKYFRLVYLHSCDCWLLLVYLLWSVNSLAEHRHAFVIHVTFSVCE